METASVVIIGGGVIGCSIAYHLALRGCSDVIVVDKNLFEGAENSSLSAGGVRHQFASEVNARMSQYAIGRYERFQEEMGADIEFHQVGYLFMATSPAQMATCDEQLALWTRLGIPVDRFDPDRIAEMVPGLNMEGIVGATFCPKDGYVDPHAIFSAYARRAREMGVTFRFQTQATGIRRQHDDKLLGVETNQGFIACETVVDAAGPLAPHVAKWFGVDVPVKPYRRQCMTTMPFAKLPKGMPMVVDMGTGLYFRPETGGLLIGMVNPDEPSSFNTAVDRPFADHVVMTALERYPLLEEAQMGRAWAGLYDVSPDHHAILGPVDGAEGLILATGFSGHGIMHAPAVGDNLASLILTGTSPIDLVPLRLERFARGEAFAESQVI
jgi:sarcosine oxidase subunit beta